MAQKQFPRFNLGDKVKFIFTEDTGVVIRVIDAESVLVRLTDGDEIPVFTEHLQLLESKTALVNKDAPNKQPPPPPPPTKKEIQQKKEDSVKKLLEIGLHTNEDSGPDNGLHLALQPFLKPDGMIDYFLVHFINNSPRPVQFTYETELNDEVVFSLAKTLPARDMIILNDIPLDWLNERLLLITEGEVIPTYQQKEAPGFVPLTFSKTYTPKAKLLHKGTQLMPVLNKQAYAVPVLASTAAKKQPVGNPQEQAQPEQDKFVDPAQLKVNMLLNTANKEEKPAKTVINAEERVIDLHIEKLQTSFRHLSNSQILQIQLTAFEKSLNEAIKRQEKTMVVIHGKGTGKLRSEIFNLLRSYPQVANFANDFHHKYEFGATIIEFQYET
ncbi:hypothetical protein C7N43_00855 [Sphingobacteriales bacterium UPWRP_1]|nr:hypothetical protein B6N25_10590 [Sphingobacteriales bacterium TSM_CSS]PSJ79019.1 hypothetical protein C7N43_00855 [Sphingobacteriales bacterium UPWRP_1]